jgi:hypothetical protein
MSTKFRGQRQWIREVLTKFNELGEYQPKRLNESPDWPEWVWNLFGLLTGIAYPGVKFKNIEKWKAKDLGRFLGRQYAGEHLMVGEVPLSSKVIEEGKRCAGWAEGRVKQRNPGIDLNEWQKEWEQGMKEWMPIFKKFVQEVLASACERPYVETSAFFEAFGKAIVIKPDALLTERTMGVGDKICWTMIVMWQEIERLRSVAELHRMFEKALKPKAHIPHFGSVIFHGPLGKRSH